VAVDGGLLGPPGWVISAFEYATGRADRSSTIDAQIRAAREAGYTGTRPQLIAIGQGLISRDAFALGQGGGPGPDRAGPRGPPAVVSTPPLIPIPSFPGVPGSVPPVAVPPGTPGIPSGPSIPDRIPPRTIPVGGVIGSVLSRVIGWGAGALFYPRSTSPNDVICVDTDYGPWCPPGMPAVPAPVAVPGSRPGRRSRPRVIPGTSPRRRERPRTLPAPAIPVPRPRGRPVTISQPVVRPAPRVATGSLPQPRSLPPPVTKFPAPGNLPMPSIPTAAAANPLIRALPMIAAIVLPSIGAWVGSGARAMPRVGSPSIPAYPPSAIPGLGTFPGIGPQPLPMPALAPLTAYSTAVAQSPAQDLDRQCRERAKQKRKRKKPKDRAVCYRGTFYELKKGTRKQRKEKIPCR